MAMLQDDVTSTAEKIYAPTGCVSIQLVSGRDFNHEMPNVGIERAGDHGSSEL